MGKEIQDKIAEGAYDLYEKNGRREGFHFEDWIEAEKKVISELSGGLAKLGTSKIAKTKVASIASKGRKSRIV